DDEWMRRVDDGDIVLNPHGYLVRERTTPYGNTAWKHRVETPCGNTVWKHRVETPCGNTAWKHRLEETFLPIVVPSGSSTRRFHSVLCSVSPAPVARTAA